jgi:3-phosphoglycerate kinase
MIHTPRVLDIKEKNVLVRVDFNVPLKKVVQNGNTKYVVSDDQRIRSALETILFLREHGAKIILMSHLGRPDGQAVKKFSLEPVAFYLKHNLGLDVQFATDCIGEKVAEKTAKLKNGDILLLENLRFHQEEEDNNATFAKKIIKDTKAEVFINEAFSASHRAHASVVGIAELLPSFAGFDLAAEVKILVKILEKAPRPFVVVLGGAKIDDKVSAIKNLSKLADLVLVGGGIANAFLKASGIEVHKSFMGKNAEENVQIAKEILSEHQTERTMIDVETTGKGLPLPKVVVPIDVLAAKNQDVDDDSKILRLELLKNVKDSETDLDLQYLDIGKETIALYKYLLSKAKTIFFNGPLGVFENPLFAKGSREIAKNIASNTTDSGAITICGGGETNAVINACGLRDRFTHVSTAGGAALEFLGGEKLPGIEVLKK